MPRFSAFAKEFANFYSASKKIGNVNLFGALGSGLSAAGINPIVAGITAIGVALAGVGAIIKHVNEAPAKAAEQFQTSFSKWQTSSSELESINTQLSETNTQIASLEAQSNLTFAEQSELDRLKKISDELRVQEQIKAQIADADAKQAAKDAANALDKNKGWLTNQGEIETERNRYNSDLSGAGKDKIARDSIRDDYISTAINNNSNDMDSQIVAYEVANKKLNKLEKDLKKAIRKGDTTSQNDIRGQIDSVNGDIDSIKQNAANVAYELAQMNSDIAQLPESELKANKKLKDYYDRTAESIREYQKVFDPDAWRENTVADVMGSDESFYKMRQGLENMAKANGDAGVSVEQLQSKYPKLASALSKAGINLTDYVSDLNASVKSTNESADALDTVRDSIESSATSTSGTVNGIKSIQSLLASQTTGKSVSYDDLNTDELKDYASALEYVNGSMQINADKAREIAKAKSEEQIELNNTTKALSQQDYLQNAAKIESLRKAIATSAGTESQAIQGQIDSLLAQNDAIAETCAQYDLLNASITEAMGAYQNWINSQNAAQTGDMFDGAQSALKKIDDTLNKSDSDSYGRVGRSDYKAAIDFVVPDSVDSTDTAAVNSYLNSIDSLFTHDSNGERAGLNIENFCKEATEKGLMVLDEAGDGYKIAGGKTMQDFADGMNLAMPFVQSVFGEMQEFGATFDWADEAPKTMGDLAVAAGQAAESIRGVDQFKDLSIKMDVSDIDTAEGQIQALDSTISEMETVKSKVAIDSSEAQEANAVIAYCLAQKQALSQPDVMRVDTSQVSGAIGEAIGLLQQFQAAQNNLEIKQKVGADTSEAEAQVQSLASQIQGLSPDVKANLSLDTTSVSSIQASINGLTAKMMVDVGIKDEAVQGYIAQEKNGKGKVTWTNDSSKVDAYAGTQKSASGKVTWYNDVANVKTTFTATGTVNWTNTTPPSGGGGGKSKGKGKGGGGGALGTAHASGTAKASGDWGTKVTQKTLVGELGTEIVVSPRSGRWYTVGDNGAEMVDIPKDSIIFNHIQSEEILKNGYTLSRGTALASGTAAVNGKIPKSAITSSSKKSSTSSSKKKKKKSSSSSKSKSSGSSKSSSSSKGSSNSNNAKDDSSIKDWIKVRWDRAKRTVEWFTNVFEDTFRSAAERLGASNTAINALSSELSNLKQGRARYEQEINSLGLSADMLDKVKNGAIDIAKLDKDTADKVSKAEGYYEQMLSADDRMVEIQRAMAEIYKNRFENIQKDYEGGILTGLKNIETMTNNGLENETSRQNYLGAYDTLADNYQTRITNLQDEAKKLQETLDSAVSSGAIKYASAQWYDLRKEILAVREEIQEYQNNISKLSKQRLEAITKEFETQASDLEHIANMLDKSMDVIEERGYLTSSKMYSALADNTQKQIADTQKELNQINAQWSAEIQKGLQVGSEAWNEYKSKVQSTEESLQNLNLEYLKFNNNVRKTEWDHFDYLQDRISNISEEAEFLQKLMSNKQLFDKDSGKPNAEAYGTAGVLAESYGTAMYQADLYGDELKKVNSELAKDPNNKTLLDRQNDLIKAQRSSILEAEDQKNALKSLAKDGIDALLSSLDKLIDKYEDTLDSQKDVYDYSKKIGDITKDISSYQKQLAALSGDDSEETNSRMQKLQSQLEDRQKDLQDTEMDHATSEIKSALSAMRDQYEEVLNKRLDNIDQLVSDMISGINANADTVSSAINDAADKVGYDLTDFGASIIKPGVTDMFSFYGEDFRDKITTLNETISAISTNVQAMVVKSNEMADSEKNIADESVRHTEQKEAEVRKRDEDAKARAEAERKAKEAYDQVNTTLYRLYNANNGDHMYTTSTNERDALVKAGWKNEGQATTVPTKSNTAVYRVYNKNTGQHHFTSNAAERDMLVNAGWNNEGIGWYASDDKSGVDTYRLYNPNSGAHLLTTSKAERDSLIKAGWKDEGVGFKASVPFKKYKRGGLVDYTGRAQVDGTTSNPELVLDSIDTKNFLMLKDTLRNIADGKSPFSSLLANKGLELPDAASAKIPNGAQNMTVGDTNVQITIPIDHVQDYNDMLCQIAKDKNAQKLLQAITVDRIAGKGALSVNKFVR